MGTLSVIQTIWANALNQLGQTTLLSTRAGAAPQLVLDDPNSGTRTVLDISNGVINPASAQVSDLDPQNATYAVSVNGRDGLLPAQTYGISGQSSYAWLDSIGFAGNLVAQHRLSVGGNDWVIMAPVYGQGLSTYRIGSDGTPNLVTRLDDTNSSTLSGISAIDSLWINGTPYVVTASSHENSVSVLQLGSNGQLWPVDQLGDIQNVPFNTLTALQTVSVYGTHYVITAGYGSDSLTVLEITANGQLRFVDQLNDTRETRFHQTTEMDVAVVDGRVFVAAGGSDGGVSLFQMLPDGRLVHQDTLIDTLDTALHFISGLQFVQTSLGLELYVTSLRDTGLTRLLVDTGPAGITGIHAQGTAGNDVLTAGGNTRNLRGEAGDDIMIDGAGADTLWGGAGADLFVFGVDGQQDRIQDFDPTEDRIDLSGAGNVHSLADLSINTTSDGLRLVWDDEILTVRAASGATLNAQTLANAITFETDRVSQIERAPLSGTTGNDTFIWTEGPDTINGGAGNDRKDYSNAPLRVIVDLENADRNAFAADGDVLISIEQLVGTSGNDGLYGDAAANTLIGRDGNDVIEGGAGNDWLMPGQGTNTVRGDSGTDMVSLSDLPFSARISLADGTLTAGGQTSALDSIENITGTIYADVIEGDEHANRLRGLGDYDWFLGTQGADSYDGGDGRDMISYVYATSGVTVNLATGTGQAGLASGDSYTSIERVTGSIYADLIYGGGQEEDIRGIGGYDWFIGSPGRDRFDGGSGVDTVAYWTSPTGVVASLSLGRGSTGDAARDLYTSIENLTGSGHADDLTGDNGRNVLRGLGGSDTLNGYGGVDRLEGGAGNDTLDGGWGWDVAIFSGTRNEYDVITNADGSLTVHDDKTWRDGVDQLSNIEALQFDDGLFYF